MPLTLSTWIPTRKLQASGIAGVIGSIVVVALHRSAHVDIDPDIVVPIVASLMLGISYAIPPAERDLLGKVDAAVKADAATGDPMHKALMQAFLDMKDTGQGTIPAGVPLPAALTLQSTAAVQAGLAGPSRDEVKRIVAEQLAALDTAATRAPAQVQAAAQAQAQAQQNVANATSPATLPAGVYGNGAPQPA